MLVAEALRVSRDQRPSMASGRTDATRGWALHCDQPVVRRSARPDSTVCRTTNLEAMAARVRADTAYTVTIDEKPLLGLPWKRAKRPCPGAI